MNHASNRAPLRSMCHSREGHAPRVVNTKRHFPTFLTLRLGVCFTAIAAWLLAFAPILSPCRADATSEQEAADGICHGHLIFCNEPERIRMAGAYADAQLRGGHTYTVFFHFRNVTHDSGAFVLALHGSTGKPFRFVARQGFADPQNDPPLAGRQAMARFLSAPEKDYRGTGGARFAYRLGPRQVASGVVSFTCTDDARMRIYYKHDRWTVPHSGTIVLAAPHRERSVTLTAENGPQSFRIGTPESNLDRQLDGNYGILYAFHVQAPPGRRVRVSFSPRGGKGGLVGSLNGTLLQTGIVPATHWAVYCETVVGKRGVRLTTAPFGGVFYPVELSFRLL